MRFLGLSQALQHLGLFSSMLEVPKLSFNTGIGHTYAFLTPEEKILQLL
jgi:hypothetical protein